MRTIFFIVLCLSLLAAGCRKQQQVDSGFGLDGKYNKVDVSTLQTDKWHEFATVAPATDGVILWAKAGLVNGSYQVVGLSGQRGPVMVLELRIGQEEAVPLKPGEKVFVGRKQNP
jgi:hypothetical protein